MLFEMSENLDRVTSVLSLLSSLIDAHEVRTQDDKARRTPTISATIKFICENEHVFLFPG